LIFVREPASTMQVFLPIGDFGPRDRGDKRESRHRPVIYGATRASTAVKPGKTGFHRAQNQI